uniref:Putative glutathione s-transferase glutathione s-transferase n=1 Tax=Corethrella appendiculata TaxID=1370023 RepID=U5EVI8_9DIPT
MNTGKHLSKGSNPPTFPDNNTLRLYSMRFCPYAQRIHLVLDAKKIPYNVVYINLSEKPEWFAEKSPLGKVPALEIPDQGKGSTLVESLIIADYLDEKYPEIKLHSDDSFQKARDRIFVERFNSVISPYYRILFSTTGIPPGSLSEFVTALDVFEGELKARATAFFGGNKPNMLDYMIWPWCERADALRLAVGDKYELDKERFEHLLKWRDEMIKDEAVKKSFISAENHAKFVESRKNEAQPNYDMLVNEAKKPRLD